MAEKTSEKKEEKPVAKKATKTAAKKETKAASKPAAKKAAATQENVTRIGKSDKIRIRLKAYDHVILEQSAERIVDTAKKTGAKVSGPIPLPTEKEVVTILRSPHKHKDSREQFELRTHKRVIDILYPTNKTMEALMKVELPAGVEVEMK